MKDYSAEREVELKLPMPDTHEDVLRIVRAALPDGWSIVRRPSTISLDTYFDTPERSLHATSTTFRVRRWKLPFSPKGFNANWKFPPVAHGYSEREELKTKLDADEIMQYRHNAIPGAAARAAYEWIAMHCQGPGDGPAGSLRPAVHVASQRQTYGVTPSGGPEWYVFLVLFDACTTFRIDDGDAERFFRTGSIGWESPRRVATFAEAEIELNTVELPAELSDAAWAVFRLIVEHAHEAGGSHILNKYSQALAVLGDERSGHSYAEA